MSTIHKTRFSTLLLVVLVLSLAACQAGIPTSQVVPSTGTEIPPTPEAVVIPATPTAPAPTALPTATLPALPDVDISRLNGIELTIQHPWINGQGAAFEALVAGFNASNAWGIQLTAIGTGGFEAVADALTTAGMQTDLVIARGFDLASLSGSDSLADLRPYFNDTEWGAADYYQNEAVFSVLAPQAGENISLWYLPIAYEPGLLYYNQTWAEELGFAAPPKTPSELKEQMLAASAEKLQDENVDNNGAGGLWISASPAAALSWYRAFSGQFDKNAGILSFNNTAATESFTYLKTLFDEDVSWIGAQLVPHGYFSDRLALAYEGTLDDLPIQEGAFSRASSEDEWVTLPYPTADGVGSLSMETVAVAVAAGSP
ncbi:MAG: hypothetical protein WA110_02350, partial [Anaerolineaceae bacterium]